MHVRPSADAGTLNEVPPLNSMPRWNLLIAKLAMESGISPTRLVELRTLGSALLLVPVAGMGALYTTVALAAGAWFVIEAHQLYGRAIQHVAEVRPMRVFHSSITYLTLLFLAVAVDPFLPF